MANSPDDSRSSDEGQSSIPISKKEVSWVWSQGLVGQQLSLDAATHEHTFEKACPMSDFYTINNGAVGEGRFGYCRPGSHRASETSCIVKVVNKESAGKEYLRNFEDRGQVMFGILLKSSAEGHSNVVKYLDFLIGSDIVFVVMEPLRGPELFEYLNDLDNIPESSCRNIMEQVISAVSFCHKWGIIHRDVKLENFRFRHAEDRHDGLALLDFGSCCPSQPHETREAAGTLLYTAPEVFSGDYSKPVDLWASGVILYVILTGLFPFNSDSYNGTENHEFAGDHLEIALDKLDATLPAEAVDLLKSLLVLDPKKRLTAADALKHKWFNSPAPAKEEHSLSRKPFTCARSLSPLEPKITRKRLSVIRQLSDLERSTLEGLARTAASPCGVLTGSVRSPSAPCNIMFLDVDGVLAPCVNAGQIVKQCVQAAVTVSKIANAHIVLTSVWRLIEGKQELLNNMLHQYHDAGPIFDVIPDLHNQEIDDDLPDLDPKRLIRVNDKKGFSEEDAVAALQLLGISDQASKDAMRDVFSDKDFDLHVFSEGTCKYSRECFSPRSRRAADWVHQPCERKFAETRCREIMTWLDLAAKADIKVKNWVVLDDDDLVQSTNTNVGLVRQRSPLRTGSFSAWTRQTSLSNQDPFGGSFSAGSFSRQVSAFEQAETPFTRQRTPFHPGSRKPSREKPQFFPPDRVAAPIEVDPPADEDDDPWAMAF